MASISNTKIGIIAAGALGIEASDDPFFIAGLAVIGGNLGRTLRFNAPEIKMKKKPVGIKVSIDDIQKESEISTKKITEKLDGIFHGIADNQKRMGELQTELDAAIGSVSINTNSTKAERQAFNATKRAAGFYTANPKSVQLIKKQLVENGRKKALATRKLRMAQRSKKSGQVKLIENQLERIEADKVYLKSRIPIERERYLEHLDPSSLKKASRRESLQRYQLASRELKAQVSMVESVKAHEGRIEKLDKDLILARAAGDDGAIRKIENSIERNRIGIERAKYQRVGKGRGFDEFVKLQHEVFKGYRNVVEMSESLSNLGHGANHGALSLVSNLPDIKSMKTQVELARRFQKILTPNLGARDSAPEEMKNAMNSFVNGNKSRRDTVSGIVKNPARNKLATIQTGRERVRGFDKLKIKLSAGMDQPSLVKAISPYLSGTLGQTPEMVNINAPAIAKMLENRSGTLFDGGLHIADSKTGRSTRIPLTKVFRNPDGELVSMQKVGQTYFPVPKVNPHGIVAPKISQARPGPEIGIGSTTRPMTRSDILTGYSPEYLMNFERDPSKMKEIFESLHVYDGSVNTARTAESLVSSYVSNVNNSISYQHGHEVDPDTGNYRLRQLSSNAGRDGSRPETDMVRIAVGEQSVGDQTFGVSASNYYSLSDTNAVANQVNISPIPSVDRGSSIVTAREGDYAIGRAERLNGSMSIGEQLKESILQPIRDHGGLTRRYDMAAVSSTYLMSDEAAKMSPHIFGSSATFADGFGLIGKGHAKDLTKRNLKTFRVQGNSHGVATFLNLPENISGIQGMTEEERVNFFKKNPVEIKQGGLIAIDRDGAEIRLHEMYSGGTLHDISYDDHGGRIMINAEFNPSEKSIMKGFGVDSKAQSLVVDDEMIYQQIALDHLHRSGQISELAPGQVQVLNGQSFNLNREKDKGLFRGYLSGVANRLDVQSKIGSARLVRASEVKMDKVVDAILPVKYGKNRAENIELETKWRARASALSESLFGGSDLNKRVNQIGAGTYSNLREMREARASMATEMIYGLYSSGHRSADSIGVTISANSLPQERDTFSRIIAKKELVSEDDLIRGNAESEVKSIIGRVFRDTSQILNLKGFASIDHGPQIHGAGNSGSMSWIDQKIMTAFGLDPKMLEKFTSVDREAIYEGNMMYELHKTNKDSIPAQDLSHIQKRGMIEILGNSGDGAVDGRYSALKSMGINSGEGFLSVAIPEIEGVDMKGFSSVNFGFRQTSHTGTFRRNGVIIRRELEAAKIDLLGKVFGYFDQSLPDNKRMAATAVQSSIETLLKKLSDASTGDNNIHKAMLKRKLKNGVITLMRPVGGDVERFVASKFGEVARRNDMFAINTEYGFSGQLKLSGLNPDDFFVKYDDKKQRFGVLYEKSRPDSPYLSKMTREPANSPGSSSFGVSVIDNHAMLPNREDEKLYNGIMPDNNRYRDWMTGDFDADSVSIAHAVNLDKEDYLKIQEYNNRQSAGILASQGLAEVTTVKGAITSVDTLESIREKAAFPGNNIEQRGNSYLRASMQKARRGKTDAPKVTQLGLDILAATHAMIADTADPASRDRLYKAGMLTSKLIENLLKSKNASNEDVLSELRTSTEKLADVTDRFIRTNGANAKEFGREVRDVLTTQLGGKIANQPVHIQEQFSAGIDDLVSGVLSHAIDVKMEGGSPHHKKTRIRSAGELAESLEQVSFSNKSIEQTVGFEYSDDTVQNIKETARYNSREVKKTMKNFLTENKKPLLIALGAGLALSVAFGSDPIDMSPNSIQAPIGDAESLEPFRDNKAYLKEKEYAGRKLSIRGSSFGGDVSQNMSSAIYGGRFESARIENMQ
jgi:hypothetical protein